MSDDLIKFEPHSQLPAEIQEQFKQESKENLEGVTPKLPKISMPTGRGKEFSLEAFEGENIDAKEVVGILLYQTPGNAYWKQKFGGGISSAPDCASHDGVRPSPIYSDLQATECASCRHNRFGSAVNDSGEKTRGKACRNVKRLIIHIPGEMIPYIMTVPPGSLTSIDNYFISLTKKDRPYWSVATKFTIATEKNAGGIEYPEIQATVMGYVNNVDNLNKIKELRETYSKILMETKFTVAEAEASDSNGGETGYVPPAQDNPADDIPF